MGQAPLKRGGHVGTHHGDHDGHHVTMHLKNRGGKHGKRARGGESGGPGAISEDGSMKGMETYAGAGSDTVKEAERRKRGGAIKHKMAPHMVDGAARAHHGNRPGRRRGGAVGADSHPMTEATNLKAPEGMGRGYREDKEDD